MKRNENQSIAIALPALLLFLWLGWLTSTGAAGPFDNPIRQEVHRWSSPVLTSLMKSLTFAGSDIFMGVLCVACLGWMFRLGRRRDAMILAITAISAELLMEITKIGFHRPRPHPFFGIPSPDTYSFPSGHAMKSAVVYFLLAWLITRRISVRLGAVILALLIGLSRIYLGVHYPTDVLAGFALATICLTIAVRDGR